MGDDPRVRCDLCRDPLPPSGGYGSGVTDDGLYCSLTCYALSSNRYVPPLNMGQREGIADHDPSSD